MSDRDLIAELIAQARERAAIGADVDPIDAARLLNETASALEDAEARQVDEAEPDAREHLHAKCDCVPDLGPEHCHLCSKDAPVAWEDCEAVREVADAPEPVDVVLTTADIEKLTHLLVQLSPATQKNGGATVRRLMQEMNIKEVSK